MDNLFELTNQKIRTKLCELVMFKPRLLPQCDVTFFFQPETTTAKHVRKFRFETTEAT